MGVESGVNGLFRWEVEVRQVFDVDGESVVNLRGNVGCSC